MGTTKPCRLICLQARGDHPVGYFCTVACLLARASEIWESCPPCFCQRFFQSTSFPSSILSGHQETSPWVRCFQSLRGSQAWWKPSQPIRDRRHHCRVTHSLLAPPCILLLSLYLGLLDQYFYCAHMQYASSLSSIINIAAER